MSQFIADNFISHLKDVVPFEGAKINEEGLLKGQFNGETAGMCDPDSFMDILLNDFPQVVVTVHKGEDLKWRITGGSVGVGEDKLSPFDNEAIAGYILSLLGYEIPVSSTFVRNVDREPGSGADGSYFIPSVDKTEGVLILPNTHRQVVLERLEHDADEQVVIGSNDLDDTSEIVGSYLAKKGTDIDPEITVGILAVSDGGTPYRIDKILVPNLKIEFEVEMLYCMNWEARISSVTDLSLNQETSSSTMDNQKKKEIVDMINKELCDRGSVIRIRGQQSDGDVYVIGLMRDSFIVDEVALPLRPNLMEFISNVYAAEGLQISFNNTFSRYWITGPAGTEVDGGNDESVF
ncbi:hypothetical protein EHV15_35885 [Paenibacillus oralis]|uniref:Uncharacterized protein n=1 Tax=Paenibacillus oralis TaxID=2490856 RepID=A0A3P3TBQ1_9BACL|nr:hypothetical protein [Paenibacillus oralis]RRJ54954.1 hypothetical protein EHV15_35885 [Paenibacillus oralis]